MCDTKAKHATELQGITKQCPTCAGKKIVPGACSCSAEWRGTQQGDAWEDCKCYPELECPTCHGAGTITV